MMSHSKNTMAGKAFAHSIIHSNMSLLEIMRHDFTDEDWEDFRQAHQYAYRVMDKFHFILDIRSVNPSHCSHIWSFIQYLSSIKDMTEQQVVSIYVVTQHNGIITSTIENLLRWYGNTIEVRFVDSVEAAVQDKLEHHPSKEPAQPPGREANQAVYQ